MRRQSVIARLRSRVTPGAWFAIQLAAGVAVFVAAAWIFGAIAEDVVEKDPITVVDAQLAAWLHLHTMAPFTQLMLAVSLAHGIAGITVLATLFTAWLAIERDRYWLIAVVLAVPGGMVLNVLLKFAFHRERPHFDDPLVTLATFSFPSGHTLGATVFYGVLAAYLLTRIESTAGRLGVVGGALAMIILVAASRMYLGAHFLSDVVAAIVEGVAWLALCMIATTTLQRRRRQEGRV